MHTSANLESHYVHLQSLWEARREKSILEVFNRSLIGENLALLPLSCWLEIGGATTLTRSVIRSIRKLSPTPPPNSGYLRALIHLMDVSGDPLIPRKQAYKK